MTQISFITTWPEVRGIISDHPLDFPRSNLRISMIQYLEATHAPEGKNKSFVMTVGGKPAVAMMGWEDNLVWGLIGGPAFLEFPQIAPCSSLGHAEIIKPLARFLRSKTLAKEGLSVSLLMDYPVSTAFMRETMSLCTNHGISFEGTVSLDDPIEEILRNFSSGHRQSIKKGEKVLSRCETFGAEVSPQTFSDFRAMHALAAGGITRSEESWGEMYIALLESRAFLTVANLGAEPVGFSFFWTTSYSALYGSAAYNRRYFSQVPVSHHMIFESMKFLKRRGISKLFLGEIFSPQGTQKEQAIAEFKRGFTRTTEAVHILELRGSG
jgi:hypothetical protein